MSAESSRLFEAMIREDDDEKRAEIRRRYVMAISLEARESVARYRKGRPLGFSWPSFRSAFRRERG